jgi:CRP-like cAMP-binding protein
MAIEAGKKRITRELLFAAFRGPPRDTDDPRVLDRLLAAVETQTRRAGDILYREGDDSEHVHFMTEGRVRLSRPGYADWVYEGWWVIGTSDALVGRRRTRTAVVETETRFFRLPSALWFEANRDQPDSLLDGIVGFARGSARLHVDLAPEGCFRAATHAAAPVDASTLAGRTRALASVFLLRGLAVQLLVELASAAEIRDLAADEPLFSPGAPPRRIFLVTAGRIEIQSPGGEVRAAFGPGSLVGDLLYLSDEGAAWSARAADAAQVLCLSVDDLFDHAEERVEAMHALMTAASLERERLCEALAARRGELVLR